MGDEMPDPRVQKLARVLVHYSLGVKEGEWVRVNGSYLAEELILAAHDEILAAGAHPSVNTGLPEMQYRMLRNASDDQLKFLDPAEKLIFEKADKHLFVMGGWNTKELTRIDPVRMVLVQNARRPLMKTLMKRTASGEASWCGTAFPTQSAAQDAEMSLPEYRDFVFSAGLVDSRDPVAEWKKLSARQAKIAAALGRISNVRIVGDETDLTLSVKGRTWVNCDGRLNFPDGEVFTSPVENSAEGTIRYAFPAVYRGREVTNVRLVFRKGRAVEARADKGEDFLNAMLDSDAGARRIGELAFGTNPAITTFTRSILFDEKIGGTVHIALGDSLPGTGGKNRSSLHWDMICDTRRGFVIYGDGKPIHRNGRFLIGKGGGA